MESLTTFFPLYLLNWIPSTSVVVSFWVRVHFPSSWSHLRVAGRPKLTLYTIGLVSVELRQPENREKTRSRILLLMILLDLFLKCNILINASRCRCIFSLFSSASGWYHLPSHCSLKKADHLIVVSVCLSQCPSPYYEFQSCARPCLACLTHSHFALLRQPPSDFINQ